MDSNLNANKIALVHIAYCCGAYTQSLLQWKHNLFSVYCLATYHYQLYNTECCRAMLLWQTYVAGNNKMYIGVHVKCPLFLPDCNQMWFFSKGFHKSSQYQILC